MNDCDNYFMYVLFVYRMINFVDNIMQHCITRIDFLIKSLSIIILTLFWDYKNFYEMKSTLLVILNSNIFYIVFGTVALI